MRSSLIFNLVWLDKGLFDGVRPQKFLPVALWWTTYVKECLLSINSVCLFPMCPKKYINTWTFSAKKSCC